MHNYIRLTQNYDPELGQGDKLGTSWDTTKQGSAEKCNADMSQGHYEPF